MILLSTDFLEKFPLEKFPPLYGADLAAEGRQSPKIKCFGCGLRNPPPLVAGDLATRGGNFSRKSVDVTRVHFWVAQ